jgi:hypothetical protein
MKLTPENIAAMRMEVFNKVKDAKLRSQILTIAFAYGDEMKDDPNATDMMAWYLAQEENRHLIPKLAMEYQGYTPDDLI